MRTVYTKLADELGLGKEGTPVVETAKYTLPYLALHGYSADVEDGAAAAAPAVETGAMASPAKVGDRKATSSMTGKPHGGDRSTEKGKET